MQEKHIGQKLKQLRKSRDLKQCEVADAIGLSRASISNIESGRRSLTLNTLKKFADFYKIDISYFELDSSKDDVIDLVERTRKIFENDAVPEHMKEDLYLQVMSLYLRTKGK